MSSLTSASNPVIRPFASSSVMSPSLWAVSVARAAYRREGGTHSTHLPNHDAPIHGAQREHTPAQPHEGNSAHACGGGLTTD